MVSTINNIYMNIREIEDRLLLRELVDEISILGDQKDFNRQVLLFTQDAVSETWAAGKLILKLDGRGEMVESFMEFLHSFHTVYHLNGQQIVSIADDKASGTCYCLVSLISEENGRETKTTIGAIYQDEYIRLDGQWLISKRIGHFQWQDKVEIS